MRILKIRFDIGESRRTFREIGQIFNVTTERVRQIKVRALVRLHRFGKLTGRIKAVQFSLDLTPEQVKMLLKVMYPEMLADGNDECSSVWK